MAAVERILGTDSGKVAFEKTDRNIVAISNETNKLIKKTNIGIYNSYNSLGQPAKWNSIEECIASMGNDIFAVLDIQTNFNEPIKLFPSGSGLVTVVRQNGNRCYMLFNESTTLVSKARMWFTWYRELETIKFAWRLLGTVDTLSIDELSEYALQLEMKTIDLEELAYSTNEYSLDIDSRLTNLENKKGDL